MKKCPKTKNVQGITPTHPGNNNNNDFSKASKDEQTSIL